MRVGLSSLTCIRPPRHLTYPNTDILDRPAPRERPGAGPAWRLTMPSVPYVLEKHGTDERVFDIYSRLMKDRIIFMLGEVDDESANLVVCQMLYLIAEDSKSDIHLYINSPGGSVTAGMSIVDVMRAIPCH